MGKYIFHFFDGVSLNDNCPGPPTAMSEHNNSLVVRTFISGFFIKQQHQRGTPQTAKWDNMNLFVVQSV